MYNDTYLDKNQKESKYYLFNILTDEIIEIIPNINNLKDMLDYLLTMKYYNIQKLSDNDFIAKMRGCMNDYL